MRAGVTRRTCAMARIAPGVCASAVGAAAWGQIDVAASDADVVLSLPGAAAGERFGQSVAGGSTVAPPGDDVLVGAPFRGASDNGAVFVFDGLTGALVRTFAGAPGAHQGWSAMFAPDANGNGAPEALMGAPRTGLGGGSAFVSDCGSGQHVFGASSPDGPTNDTWFGAAVATGEFTGGGPPDLLVGAPRYQAFGVAVGRVLRYDGDGGAGQFPVEYGHNLVSNRIGTSIVSLGDVFGNDGIDDFVVSGTGVGERGRALIYSGADTFLYRTLLIAPQPWLSEFGASMARLTDMDGGGAPDVAVGSPDAFGGRGQVFAFSVETGAEVVPGAAGVLLLGSAAGDRFGSAVAEVGDVDGDGVTDFIVGAPATENGGAGFACVYSGRTLRLLRRYTGEHAGDAFGAAVAGAGDANGDGVPDVVVGAPGYDEGRGRAYVFFSPRVGDVNADGVVEGADVAMVLSAWGACGAPAPAACVGDVDGDGGVDGADLAVVLGEWGR